MIARPRSVHGFGRLCWATTNTMPFRATRLSCAFSVVAFVDCGEASSSVAVNARECAGSVSPHSCSGGFRNPAFCIPILMRALPLIIQGKSRMRKRACTDLCGGRSAMVVPTATAILGPALGITGRLIYDKLSYRHVIFGVLEVEHALHCPSCKTPCFGILD